MKKIYLYALWLLAGLLSFQQMKAQDDLLSLVGQDKPKKERVKYAFKSPRVINNHSMEFLNPGTMDFRILHRFGPLDQGYKNFYGFDQANMRIGLDFGLLQNLMVGIGRSNVKKEVDGYFKYAPIRQSTGPGSFPVTIALVAGMTMNTSPWQDPARKNFYTSRLAYYFETVIGRKFSDKFTFQVSPIVVHNNIVAYESQSNDIYALAFGARMKISQRVAITADYSHNFNGLVKGVTYDPASIGLDIETGGHVFQLHFSNAVGMNERAFLMETTNSWAKKQMRFGFNLSRVFQISKKKK
jgi:hypothetical protein